MSIPKRKIAQLSGCVKISRTTGGAYTDMSYVVKSELRRIKELRNGKASVGHAWNTRSETAKNKKN
jgi:hypothetical protein